jgi:hypothetical protein
VVLAAAAALALAATAAPPGGFETWEPGLEVGWFRGPEGAPDDGLVVVVRLDPARYELRLLNASAPGEGKARSVRDWAWRAGAVAAVNASLFQEDWRTSVSLMRTRDHVNHPRLSKDMAVLAFDPLQDGLPPVRIIDRQCDDLEAEAARYGALVQSIRMVACDGRNVWAPQPRRASAAAIGTDRSGRLLLIHARSPWPVHDLVKALQALPLGLARAMYVEGGPEAQLYVRGGGREALRLGLPAHGLPLATGLPVPNVLAVLRREPSPAPPARAPDQRPSSESLSPPSMGSRPSQMEK